MPPKRKRTVAKTTSPVKKTKDKKVDETPEETLVFRTLNSKAV